MARIKIDMPDRFIFSTEIPVRITDLNYGNHLGNDALLGLIHEARMQFLSRWDYTEMDVDGCGLIMADAAIVYKAQAYYGDRLTIRIHVLQTSRKSCDFFYRIEKHSSEVVALAKTAIVFFDYKQNKPVNIPQNFLNRIKNPVK